MITKGELHRIKILKLLIRVDSHLKKQIPKPKPPQFWGAGLPLGHPPCTGPLEEPTATSPRTDTYESDNSAGQSAVGAWEYHGGLLWVVGLS